MERMIMLEGKAIGGPREGVKLTAPESWDGLVIDSAGRTDVYHSGYYFWSVVEQTWVWNNSPRSIDWGTRHYASRTL